MYRAQAPGWPTHSTFLLVVSGCIFLKLLDALPGDLGDSGSPGPGEVFCFFRMEALAGLGPCCPGRGWGVVISPNPGAQRLT